MPMISKIAALLLLSVPITASALNIIKTDLQSRLFEPLALTLWLDSAPQALAVTADDPALSLRTRISAERTDVVRLEVSSQVPVATPSLTLRVTAADTPAAEIALVLTPPAPADGLAHPSAILSAIAQAHQPEHLSLAAFIDQLIAANPQAFADQRPASLRAGSVLHLPRRAPDRPTPPEALVWIDDVNALAATTGAQSIPLPALDATAARSSPVLRAINRVSALPLMSALIFVGLVVLCAYCLVHLRRRLRHDTRATNPAGIKRAVSRQEQIMLQQLLGNRDLADALSQNSTLMSIQPPRRVAPQMRITHHGQTMLESPSSHPTETVL